MGTLSAHAEDGGASVRGEKRSPIRLGPVDKGTIRGSGRGMALLCKYSRRYRNGCAIESRPAVWPCCIARSHRPSRPSLQTVAAKDGIVVSVSSSKSMNDRRSRAGLHG